MLCSRYIKRLVAFSHSSLKEFKFISVFVFCLFFFSEDEKLRQYQCATNANQDPVLKPRLHERFFACDGDATFFLKLSRRWRAVVAKRVTKSVILSRKVQLIEFLAIFFSGVLAVAIAALARGWLHG